MTFWELICADLERSEGRQLPPTRSLRFAFVLHASPKIRSIAVIGHRLAHATGQRSSLLGALIKQLNHLLTGVDVDFRAEIGPGLDLIHPTGVVIVGGAQIGSHCTIHSGVTIGGDPRGMPVIGEHVNLGPGCRILGSVHIGDRCRVGANAVVTKTLGGDDVVLAGVPAKVIRSVRTSELRGGVGRS